MVLRLLNSLRKTTDALGIQKQAYRVIKKVFSVRRDLAVAPVLESIRKFNAAGTSGLSAENRTPRLTVSVTSFPERVNNPGILPVSLYALMTQSLKPDRIVLWLTDEEFPRREADVSSHILDFRSNGLEVRWIPANIRAYGKLVPSLEAFPDDVIVTADDDTMYRPEWLEMLYTTWLKHPRDIVAHRAKRVTANGKGIKPYNDWLVSRSSEASPLNFLTGVGGVLYPPHVLHADATNSALFQNISPLNDDIWFWAMAVIKGTQTCCVDKGLKHPVDLIPDKMGFRHLINSNLDENDAALSRLFAHYPHLERTLLDAAQEQR